MRDGPGPDVTLLPNLRRDAQVLRTLVGRDLQRRYSGLRLTYLWTFLEPAAMIAVFYLVFHLILGRDRPLGLQPYLLFLTTAILPWWWFSRSVSACTKAFKRTGKQLTVSILPRQIWIVRSVTVGMVEFILQLPLLVIACLITQTAPTIFILAFPLGMALQFVLIFSIGLLVSSWSSVFPDLGRLTRVFMRVVFYFSPIIYSVDNIPEAIRPIASLNPLVGIFGVYRVGFWSDQVGSWPRLAIGVSIIVVLLIAGTITFNRLEGRVLKSVTK